MFPFCHSEWSGLSIQPPPQEPPGLSMKRDPTQETQPCNNRIFASLTTDQCDARPSPDAKLSFYDLTAASTRWRFAHPIYGGEGALPIVWAPIHGWEPFGYALK